ncbi:metal ion transporter metal ion transporter like protein [Zymoseptoria brevis]|uniref:Metal ion transporter metal ion transporter like protein n=1 Tax=Zymoseptoria brevis TaxID=1047168 RepID=A0A0F4GAY7_9PEZI|nr:metal ion transporter metal ion transporter like protein [Zymoseptoria brevis]
MNCPSRTDPEVPDKWNQSPNALSADMTTRSDLENLASARLQSDHKLKKQDGLNCEIATVSGSSDEKRTPDSVLPSDGAQAIANPGSGEDMLKRTLGFTDVEVSPSSNPPQLPRWQHPFREIKRVLLKFSKFIGPGFMIAVAYIDPGNYATDAAAGASYRFRLLFMVLLSNIFAIVLQSISVKMSTVTGMNLAEMNKAHCAPWLNYILWFFGEAAVIATDIAEVIGFAIALNLLAPSLPLIAGCAISIVDVMFILLFYRPEGSMQALRIFETFVMMLVVGVAICFCYQLSLIEHVTPGEVFKGYLPSSALVESKGLYQACGILGATVMPHSLYLGSGLNQPRLRQYDMRHNNYDSSQHSKYRPSLSAIQSCMRYSIVELTLSLFTFALFINSAILIVCGASLYSVTGASDADLFGIYHLLNTQLGHAAATVFAVALLLSGCSAGIVCTMAGQMITEGQLQWKLKPWVTRFLTRSISIVPSILVAGVLGKKGLSDALVGSQVALSVILPFVTLPLIYYTCRNKYMTVFPSEVSSDAGQALGVGAEVKMRNGWIVTTLAVVIWVVIVVMNVANIVLTGLGVN